MAYGQSETANIYMASEIDCPYGAQEPHHWPPRCNTKEMNETVAPSVVDEDWTDW
jgi:hypothetical protein